MKIIAQNKKALFDYEILEKFAAGIRLKGFEVKSIKAGRVSLSGSFAVFHEDELYLLNVNIPAWQPQNAPKDYDPERSRKLLLNKKELDYLSGKTKTTNLTLVPISVFLKNNLIKVELGLARGKKKYDKRETIKKREAERDIRGVKY